MAEAKKKVAKKKAAKKKTKKTATGAAARLQALIDATSALPDQIRTQMGGKSPGADKVERHLQHAQRAIELGDEGSMEHYCTVLERYSRS